MGPATQMDWPQGRFLLARALSLSRTSLMCSRQTDHINGRWSQTRLAGASPLASGPILIQRLPRDFSICSMRPRIFAFRRAFVLSPYAVRPYHHGFSRWTTTFSNSPQKFDRMLERAWGIVKARSTGISRAVSCVTGIVRQREGVSVASRTCMERNHQDEH